MLNLSDGPMLTPRVRQWIRAPVHRTDAMTKSLFMTVPV